jgi:hypothetical protein
MAWQRGRGWRSVATIVALAILALVVGLLAWLLHTRGWQYAANVAGVMSVLLALPALVVPLVLWWQTRPPSSPKSSAQEVAAAQETLAGIILQQWTSEAAARSLGDPQSMPVRWRLADRNVMDHPKLIKVGPLQFSSRSDQIDRVTDMFRTLKYRRLVILGGPGAGKTTLAVQLLLKLLGSRKQGEPVPLLLSLSDWDTHSYPRLHDWLAKRLAEVYPALRARTFGADAPGAIAGQSLTLPILDGLDELGKDARAKILSALNASLTERDHLILTCRTAEYAEAVTAAGDVLNAAAVIEALPLTPAGAAGYLRTCIPPALDSIWRSVLAALRARTPPALAEALSTPLDLWLLRTVYIAPHVDPAPLLDPVRFPDKAAVQVHLLDQLIPAVIHTHPATNDPAELFRPRRQWDPTDARRRLEALAHLLHGAQTRDFAWWHLARETLSGGALRIWIGLAAGFGGGLTFGSAFGMKLGVAFGIGTGLAFEIWGIIPVETTSPIADSSEQADSQIKLPLLFRRFLGQFGIGAILGLAGGFLFGIKVGFASGLGGVLGVGLSFVSSEWLDHVPKIADFHLRKPRLVRRLAAQLGYSLVIGIGAACGFVFGLGYHLSFGLLYGAMFGLCLAIAFGLIDWAETPLVSSSASTPTSTLRGDRALTLLRMSAVGLGAGVPAGFALGPTTGLAFGLAGALGAAFAAGSGQAWVVYVLATIRLTTTGHSPHRLMVFLDDAHRLGLLRTVGPLYQFRHAALQEDLVTPNRHPQ